MGNKYVLFIIFAVVLVGGGIVYQKYYQPNDLGSGAGSGETVEFQVVSKLNQWAFEPKEFRVKRGTHVVLRIFNEDEYDHGFAIEAFGVNRRLPPKEETRVEFDATVVGEWPIYCSVACGEGHYRHTGKIFVEE